jgi:glutamine amidotransferase
VRASSSPEVLIVPTGGANLASLADAFERLGARWRIDAAPEAYERAARIVLPGVGAAPEAARRLAAGGLGDRLRRERRPVLGICLGLQLLFEQSEEGGGRLLGVLAGRVEPLAAAAGRPVPNMGWSRLRASAPSRLLAGAGADDWYYFVHSYAARPQADTVACAEHGGEFAAVVERPPYYGVQFHPERSAAPGARILANFLELAPCG